MWLQENRSVFGTPAEEEPKLAALHERLHEKSGDDDMSFVWMCPASSPVPHTERRRNGLEE
jgi:hypothetical protein